jgi:hypothetical protein
MVPKVVSFEMDPETRGRMSNRSNYDSDGNVEDSRWQRENGEAQEGYDHGDRGKDDDVYDSDDDDDDDDRRKKRRPLSKQMSIPIVILSIYRYIIFPNNILGTKLWSFWEFFVSCNFEIIVFHVIDRRKNLKRKTLEFKVLFIFTQSVICMFNKFASVA